MLKKKLKNSNPLIGTWCEIPIPYSINIMASAGLDFVILDMEHGVMEYEQVQNMVFAAHCESCGVIVRVPEISEAHILRALDTGADGIILPQVQCSQDAARIIRYSKYPPQGQRGFNPYIKAGGYRNVAKNYFEEQNEKTLIGVILEGRQAFEELDSILSEKDIDIVYIGQYDLSVALGIPGDVSNKLVRDMIQKTVESAAKHNKCVGSMVHTVEEARNAIKQGLRFIVFKVDSGVLFSAYHSFLNEVR